MDVNKKVELLINYRSCSDDTSFDEEYQSTFGGEGVRKSKYILAALSSNREASKENLSEYIFVSIGGADGSEAEEILKNTEIQKSIMIEISDTASAKARERARDLKNTLGKELVIFQGDVTQRLPDVIKRMKEFKKNDGLIGLILSIQAVIHELPRRSPNFRSSVFFGQLFSVYSKNIFFCREPIKAERWPDIVEVKVGNTSSENLSKLAEIINDKLSITDVPVTRIANGFINVNSTLALEVLHKLIRSTSVSQFEYELDEQLTSVDPDILKKTIESHLGKATVTIEPTITEGFKEAWKLHSVVVKNEQGDLLSYPNTHARLVGFSLTSEHTPSKTKEEHNKSSPRLQKKEIESNKIKIVANRTEIRGQYRDIIEGVKSRFCVYGVGLGGFAGEYRELIQEKIRQGIDVKILALSPREEIFKIYFNNISYSLLGWKDYEFGDGGTSQNESKYLQDWVFEENIKLLNEGKSKLVELRFYSTLPVGAIMIADETIFYSPSLVKYSSDENTTMVFEKYDKPYEKFNRYFENLWSSQDFSQAAINNHVLYNTHERGCLISSIRKRRKFKENPTDVQKKYSSFVEHAKQKLLYNELSPLFLQAASRNTQREVDFIRSMERVRGEAIEYIVDLGCGVGRHASILSNFYEVTGFDISNDEIYLASKSPKGNFLVGDMRDWDVDKKVDLVICMWSTFNYLSSQQDLDRFIDSCKRNLEESGILLLDLKNPNKVLSEEYTRKSYSYPYEINLKIKKELIDDKILNGIYTYYIKNIKTGESVVATDQELNRKYDLKDIQKAFSRDFTIQSVFGDYSIDSEFSQNSNRMIIVLKKKCKNPIFYGENTVVVDKAEDLLEYLDKFEDENLEFKSTLVWNIKSSLKDDKIEESVLKTIAAFNNSEGGVLLIGIDDNKNILGLDFDLKEGNLKDIDKFQIHLRNIMRTRLAVEDWYTSKNIKIHFNKVDNKDVCIINVNKGKKPIYTKDNKLFIRSGNSTIQLGINEVYEYVKNSFKI